MGIESFFSIGAPAIRSAQNVFTNRTSEIDCFDRSIQARADVPGRGISLVEDVIAPRTNVLMFYGMGGIGKSRLSQELQGKYLSSATETDIRLAFRKDFDSGDAMDLEGLLISLRAVLGTFRPSWPAFDLGLSAYWERAHPGVPIQQALNNSSALRKLTGELQLGSQIQDAVESVLGSPGGLLGIFISSARLVGKSVRDRIQEQQVLKNCPFFEPIVSESDPVAMLPYLASLMAWDLAQQQEAQASQGRRLDLAVFFDTWERVQEDEGRKGGTEDLLTRIIYLMPNALFVITGRDQLRWADPESRARMQWAGPERWPNLTDDAQGVDPRQHLVGGLSPKDAHRFLTLRLQTSGEPVIPPEIRDKIVESASGVPLYLDLSAVRYAQMTARRVPITADDFGQPFPEIVLRIMKDLDRDQRTLLRTASMVSRFDADLLLAGSPSLPDSALLQFVQRSIVQAYPNDYLPYGIHESLRDAVHRADIAEDRWSEREWAAAARKVTAEVRRRVGPELRTAGGMDRDVASGYLIEAFRLSTCTQEIEPWIWQLAAHLQSGGALDTLAGIRAVVPSGSVIGPAARGLAAIAERKAAGPETTARLLVDAIGEMESDPTGREYLNYWLAWMLDETDHWDEARDLRRSLEHGSGVFTPYIRHALARSDWVNGRLGSALSIEFDADDPLQLFWRTGIQGRVEWISGRFDAAAVHYDRRLAIAEQIGSPELVAHALRTRAEMRCFTRPSIEGDAIEAAEIYRRLGAVVSEAECLIALDIARCSRLSLVETRSSLSRIRTTFGTTPHADVAEIFMNCVAGDAETALRVRREMMARQRNTAYSYWRDITAWWIADLTGGQSVEPSDVDWVFGRDEARSAWVGVLRARA